MGVRVWQVVDLYIILVRDEFVRLYSANSRIFYKPKTPEQVFDKDVYNYFQISKCRIKSGIWSSGSVFLNIKCEYRVIGVFIQCWLNRWTRWLLLMGFIRFSYQCFGILFDDFFVERIYERFGFREFREIMKLRINVAGWVAKFVKLWNFENYLKYLSKWSLFRIFCSRNAR